MKPIAWFDPSNGVVSTDQDCPLFTPLGQVWPLCLKREWVGLTDEQYFEIGQRHWLSSFKVEQIHKELEEAAHGIKEGA